MIFEHTIVIVDRPADFNAGTFLVWRETAGIAADEWDYERNVLSFLHEEDKLLVKIRFGL
jgi:hypothetical protein